MEAIILAGGLGTRMREETEFRPKPMVEIGGRPVLWHIMKHLSTHGVRDFIIAVGYKGNMIREYFLNYETQSSDFSLTLGDKSSLVIHGSHDESDWRVTVVETGPDSPTGERVRQAAKYLRGEHVLVTYGDTLANVDVSQLVTQHRETGVAVTVTAVQPNSRFGVLDISEQDQVRSFDEKPQLEGWINIGYMVLDSDFARAVPPGSVLEQEPLGSAASSGAMSAYRHTGYWQPMDTYREYEALNQLWRMGEAPWKTWQ
jgi:glucose-1-phosphate cytidylyltransferase